MKLLPNRHALLTHAPKDGICCEIGVFRGDFSQRILDVAKPSKLYLVDMWKDFLDTKGEDNKAHVEDRFAQDARVEIMSMPSAAALSLVPENSLDFIYLDGNHSYENMLPELLAAYSRLKPNGLLAGHDYCMLREFGVVRAVAVFCHIKRVSIDFLTDEKEVAIDPKYKPKKRNWPDKLAYNSFGIIKKV